MADALVAEGGEPGRVHRASEALRRAPAWTLMLAATTAYIVLFTDDVYIVRIPLKLYLVGATLIAWWLARDRNLSLSDYPLAAGVLALGVAAPVLWTLVAAGRAGIGDSVGNHDLTYILQHASRFGYLLLYFPLLDLCRRNPNAGVMVWLIPVFVLCGGTAVIVLVHLATGNDYGTTSVAIFKGVIGSYPEGFRVFIGNQVVLMVAMAFLISSAATRGLNAPRALGLAVLIATAYVSHTRGIWLGISAVCATAVLLLILRELSPRMRVLALALVGAGVALIGGLGIALLAGAHIPGFLGDSSAGSRVSQAPELFDAFRGHPIIGDGLGATLASGFERSQENPWSFELTYLQILFQMGVVGLILILAVPGMAIWRCGIRAVGRPAGPLSGDLAAASGLVGILVASSTNPYLFSSFGMVSLAILFSLAGVATLSSRGETHPPFA